MGWVDGAKRRAAKAAAQHVESGTVIGLGTGSTAKHLIQIVGAYLSTGRLTDIQGVPTSIQTSADAQEAGIPLTTLDDHPTLELSIDGADLIDGSLNALKGGGGALLREKIVASASETYILIADERKIVEKLGTGFPLPIEVLPFSVTLVADRIGKLGASVVHRSGQAGPVVTDNGNFILDADFGPIDDPVMLERQLKSIPGVLETGLFIGYADIAYVGTPDAVRTLQK
jgi:ribose 5-phosphate isomerase A